MERGGRSQARCVRVTSRGREALGIDDEWIELLAQRLADLKPGVCPDECRCIGCRVKVQMGVE